MATFWNCDRRVAMVVRVLFVLVSVNFVCLFVYLCSMMGASFVGFDPLSQEQEREHIFRSPDYFFYVIIRIAEFQFGKSLNS